MEMSYFERAKRWVETADDVDIENLEATIGRFAVELKKFQISNPMQHESKIKDPSATLTYLKEKLCEVAGVDELPSVEGVDEVVAHDICDNYAFDPSPLGDTSDSEAISLSPEEKAAAVAGIRKLPGIISGGELIQKARSA